MVVETVLLFSVYTKAAELELILKPSSCPHSFAAS